MADFHKLSDAEIESALDELDGWQLLNGKLHRSFQFADFTEAFGFLTKVAIEANSLWHHPEIYNVWNKVKIDLVTHEADDSISDLDITLARKINGLLHDGGNTTAEIG